MLVGRQSSLRNSQRGEDDDGAMGPRRSFREGAVHFTSEMGSLGEPETSSKIKFERLNSHRYIKGTTFEKPAVYEGGNALHEIMFHPINIMLVFLPLGVTASFFDWGPLYVFWFNFLAMIPLAKILGDATEELAAGLKNDMIAGLLNATFGNAVEMVITISTLRQRLYGVVKATLLGSVLSNTLLVLGMSFLCGGIVQQRSRPKTAVPIAPGEAVQPPYESVSSDQQMESEGDRGVAKRSIPGREKHLQATECLSSPPPARNGEGDPADLTKEVTAITDASAATHDLLLPDNHPAFVGEKIQNFSVLGALVNTSMLLISCMSLSLITVFQAVRSKNDDISDEEYKQEILLPVSRIASIIIMLAYGAYTFFQLVTHRETMAATQEGGEEQEEEENDASSMSTRLAMSLLFGVTVLVSISAELLVAAIRSVAKGNNMSQSFIGIVLLPIVGNACEHAAAVRFAMQDKMGLSVSIAVGSSTQIALFVVPFSVLAGWVFGLDMDLDFGTLSTSMITLSVIVVLSMVVDGQSNWLQGYLLCSVYAIIAVMYWYLPDDQSLGEMVE